MEMQNTSNGQMCKCSHHKIVPILIALIGVLFLLFALKIIGENVTMIGWPISVIFIGLNKMMSGKCKCCVIK